MASVTVEDSKKGCLFDSRSKRLIRLRARLLQIKYNRNSIFVVVSRSAVMGVGCVRQNEALLFARNLGRLNFWNYLTQWPNAMISNRRRRYTKIIHTIKCSSLLWHAVIICQNCSGLQALQNLVQTSRPNDRLHARHRVLLIRHQVASLILHILILLSYQWGLRATITLFWLIITRFPRQLVSVDICNLLCALGLIKLVRLCQESLARLTLQTMR